MKSIKFNLRAISPVVATALLLVVAVVAVVGFQAFFSSYSSGLFSKVETQSETSVGNTQIENLIGNSVYFKNSNTENITINSVKVNGVDCNYSGNASNGMNEINVSSCLQDIVTTTPEVVIYTNNGIYSEKFFVKDTSIYTYLASCSLNGTYLNHGSSYSFYNSSSVPYGSSCSSQARTCNDGTLNGTSSYNISSCNVLPLNCSSLGLVGGTWITVPGNLALGTSNFCAMKFEVKNVGGIATSQGALTPWVSINQINSRNNCSALGSKYHLITNAEWTTIARNAEANVLNWNSSVVGSGFMFSGHNDNSPASALNVTNESDYYDGTNDSISSPGDGIFTNFPSNDARAYMGQKRVFILNNSEIIWDMSGNVYEWNNDTCGQGDPWYSGAVWIEWTNSNINTTEKILGGPLGIYDSNNSVGRYTGCVPAGNGFWRSGDWSGGAYAGAYGLYFNNAPSATAPSLGFRCAYTP